MSREIEKYRYDYEVSSQWELRKKFILAHRDKYPEERLVCLAQIFSNVHFLGCRYEEPVMELMSELSKGIAVNNDKWKTQAFVSASSAVEQRVKDRLGGQNSNKAPQNKPLATYVNFVKSETEQNPNVQENKIGLDAHSVKLGKRLVEEANLDNEPTTKRQRLNAEVTKIKDDIQYVIDSGPFGQIVLFESSYNNESTISVIQRTVNAAHMVVNYIFTYDSNQTTCKMMLDGLYLATGQGPSQKISKEAACRVAISRLKETSFTILVKAVYSGSEIVDRNLDNKLPEFKSASVEEKIEDTNIGSKMLKLMGWLGGGLGKNEQGMAEPVKAVESSIRRGGLGIKNFSDFRGKVKNIIRNFAYSNTKEDLVFSPDFSKDERKSIHNLVQEFNLKSRSFGKEDNRHIVIFKKIKPLEIVEDLLVCGGETDKYKLIPPESMKDRFSPYLSDNV
ncbi:NF-kappa-B-repressing factor [Cimex lectularius]|uniref:NF-kappa-B-repressing factor n=1 Tax=Cimex lectularius TaxID=79782 RepID=A0A8I6REY4_CIMLE|nr:NF-kappa-B-repressing factor [Cimex lectularius]